MANKKKLSRSDDAACYELEEVDARRCYGKRDIQIIAVECEQTLIMTESIYVYGYDISVGVVSH